MSKETTLNKPQHDHDYGAQIAVIRGDLERLQGDFATLSHEVTEDASERVKYFTDAASEKIRERSAALRGVGARGRRLATNEVHKHPLASVLTAASAGLAVGALAIWAQSSAKS